MQEFTVRSHEDKLPIFLQFFRQRIPNRNLVVDFCEPSSSRFCFYKANYSRSTQLVFCIGENSTNHNNRMKQAKVQTTVVWNEPRF